MEPAKRLEQHEFAYQQINLYSRYLKRDPRQGEILYDKEKSSSLQIQARLDSIGREHGDTYIEGIQPVFDALKARPLDSSWNWVRESRVTRAEDNGGGGRSMLMLTLTA
jgi:fatty acid synthase subunit beta